MYEDKIIQMLLRLVKLSEKKDQEITMVAHGFARHGETIDRHHSDIRQIKPLVGLA